MPAVIAEPPPHAIRPQHRADAPQAPSEREREPEIRVSVVIPTLDESLLLPAMLTALRAEGFPGLEIIVADADSCDGTAAIAHAAGARVVAGGRPGAGRNRGAAVARGKYLFFLDADVRIPPGFVGRAWREMEHRGLALGTLWFEPDSPRLLDRLLFTIANLFVRACLHRDPHAAGCALLVRRDLFERVGGFDESLYLAEDHDLVKRASRLAPLAMLRSVRLRVNVRRLDAEGRMAYAGKCIRVEVARHLTGEIVDARIPYRFGHLPTRSPGAAWSDSPTLPDRRSPDPAGTRGKRP